MVVSKRNHRNPSKVFCTKIGLDNDEETTIEFQEVFRANINENEQIIDVKGWINVYSYIISYRCCRKTSV